MYVVRHAIPTAQHSTPDTIVTQPRARVRTYLEGRALDELVALHELLQGQLAGLDLRGARGVGAEAVDEVLLLLDLSGFAWLGDGGGCGGERSSRGLWFCGFAVPFCFVVRLTFFCWLSYAFCQASRRACFGFGWGRGSFWMMSVSHPPV